MKVGECVVCGESLTNGHQCRYKSRDEWPLIKASHRGKDWIDFATKVLHHIETYTVPQYGDKGSDQCTEFDEQDFITNLKRYLNRHGKNSRPGQNKLDKIKMAHYIQMLHDLIEE